MILIEGTNLVGKTLVAQALKQFLPSWGYRHHGVPEIDPWLYFSWFLADSRRQTIVDRLHWSEWAYGKTFRNSPGIDDHKRRVLDLMLMAQGATVLYLYDDLENIQSRFHLQKSKNKGFDLEKYGELQCHFQEVYEVSPLRKHWLRTTELWDFEESKPTPLLRQIAEGADTVAKRFDKIGLFPPSLGLGGPYGFMVVGEGQDYGNCSYSPTTPLTFGFSGEWLWRAIDEQEINWTEGYFTNAFNFANPEQFREYIHGSRPDRIVCLGKTAEKLVAGANFGPDWPVVRNLAHPNYERRFKHSEFARWSTEVGEALSPWRKRDG